MIPAKVILIIVDDLSGEKFLLSIVIEHGCACVHMCEGYAFRKGC